MRMGKIMSVPALFWLIKLDTDPYDRRKKFYLFNPHQEWVLGNMIIDYDETKNFHNGSEIDFLMNDMLQHILRKNNVPNRLEWKVHVSKDQQINAVSYPGGNIVFYEPVFATFENVDQLAMVLSHEVSHILLRHSNRQVSKKALNIFVLASFFASFEFSLFEIYFTQRFEERFKLKHSRVHEQRADEWGLKLIHTAGFDID